LDWVLQRDIVLIDYAILPDSRSGMRLSPGQRVEAIVYDDCIELITLCPVLKLRGFLITIDNLD